MKDRAPAKAFVLAAGLGSRLRPLTEVTPKPLVPIANVPILLFALALLRRAGIREVGINLHHQAEKIPATLGDGSRLGLSIRYFREERLLGTGGAICHARDFLGDGDFVVVNGDTILDVDLVAMLDFHRDREGIATLAVSRRASFERFGGISFDASGRLGRLVERGGTLPQREEAAVFAGVSAFRQEIFGFLERGGEAPCLLRQGVFPAIQHGQGAFAFASSGFFADIGSPRRYLEANLSAARSESSPKLLAEAAELRAKLGPPKKEPEIGEGAAVGPDVVLGSGVRIGRKARVERAVLWDDTTVAEGATVREAIVFRDEEILPLVPSAGP